MPARVASDPYATTRRLQRAGRGDTAAKHRACEAERLLYEPGSLRAPRCAPDGRCAEIVRASSVTELQRGRGRGPSDSGTICDETTATGNLLNIATS